VDRPVSGDQVRVGVLGCSSVAWRRTLPALAACPTTHIVAVASRDAAKAARFADAFGCAATGYDDLLDRDDIDAVYLPLPTALHASWGRRVLRSGKHLLVEKPAATTSQDARELGDIAAERRLVIRENFTFLHHPQLERVRRLIADARLGEVRGISAAFCFPPLPDGDARYVPELGGGALLDAGVYPLRLVQELLDGDIAVAGAVLHHDARSGVDTRGHVLLAAASGVTADLRFGFEHSYTSAYQVWGSAACLSVDRAFTPQPGWEPVLRIVEQSHTEEHVLAAADQFGRSVASFADAIRSGRSALDADEATGWARTVRTLELVEDVVRAATQLAPTALDAMASRSPEPVSV
jgi:predicted dehydrogenase